MILGWYGIANIVFFKAYTDVFACFATSVTYLIPVVAFLGLLDNEMLTSVQFIGAFIILIGCVFIC
jgi:drug/metabolite transporter (DMT)-like permease